jgi:xyloglucan-specific exo-beta-1,4-glucanase
MVESLEIDPLDSNHWLYGTGLTLYGGHNLKSWPNVHLSSLADGIEEESVQALITPPGLNIPLISAVGDDAGFVHKDLKVSPSDSFENPLWSTTNGLDYAGLMPENIVRIGNNQLATTNNTGATWTLTTPVPATASGGSIAIAADASAIVWTSSAGSLRVIANVSSTALSSLPSGAAVVADKANAKYFYAATTTGIYVSSDSGLTFELTISLTSYNSVKMAAHPAVAGNFWVSNSQGIYHSTDFGKTVTQSTGVTGGMAIAVGKGAKNATNVYAFAGVDGVNALRLTADLGKTWSVIQTAATGFGSASSNCLAASWETAGLVFVGTNGRGIYYGLPQV